MNNKINRNNPIATRVVKTSRWIHNNDLKLGMYVRELDCAWEETQFMRQGFVVDNPHLLRDVQDVSEFVCIETEKLSRNCLSSSARAAAA